MDITEYHDMIKQFFDNIRDVITMEENQTSTPNNISKQDNIMIIKTYFECLRYLIQKFNNKNQDIPEADKVIAQKLLQENVIQPIKWCLSSTNGLKPKYFFQHSSTLVAFFDKQSGLSLLYQQLLDTFWSLLFNLTTDDLQQQDVSELYLERVIELINDLYVSNPSLEEHKVKFLEENVDKPEPTLIPKEPHVSAAFIQKELKQLVLQLLRICLKKTLTMKTSKYIKHVRLLCNMFNDKEFFVKLSEDESLTTTLLTFVNLLKMSFLDNEASETVVDVVFEILNNLEKQQRFEFIEKELLKVSN